MARCLVFIALLTFAAFVNAADPDMLQDFCVADNASPITINGKVCKPAAAVSGADFKSAILKNPGNTNNKLGSAVQTANVNNFPGLNTLGVGFARLDYAPGGTNPPHIHPRGTELLYLLEGQLLCGFVSTTNNTLFATTINPGELFVFPRGLIHFQINIGKHPAVAFAGFNSQNPGTSQVAKAVFASNPPIFDEVLLKAFQLDQATLQKLRALIGQT